MAKYGKIQFADGIYTGLIENDAANIAGVFKFNDGRIYVGQFVNNSINGYGALIYSDKSIYLGSFSSSLRNGKFAAVIKRNQYQSDDEYFIGNYSNDKRNGRGVSLINKEFLDIKYSNDNPIGSGFACSYWGMKLKKVISNGSSLKDEYIYPSWTYQFGRDMPLTFTGNSKRKVEGFGAIKTEDGRFYIGNFSSNEGKLGLDDFTCNGYRIIGDSYKTKFSEATFAVDPVFKRKFGYGSEISEDYLYVGNFNGGPNGFGIYVKRDGSYFSMGNFKDSKLHGEGIYISINGHIEVGNFSNGSLNGSRCIKGSLVERLIYQGEFKGGMFNGNNVFPFNSDVINYSKFSISDCKIAAKPQYFGNFEEKNVNSKPTHKLTGFTEADYNMSLEEYRNLDEETKSAMSKAYIEEWKRKSADRDKIYQAMEEEKEKKKPDYFLKQKGYVLNDEYKKLVNLFYMTEIDRLNALRDETNENFIIPEGIKSTNDSIWNNNKSVKTVKFPKTFTELGNNNFLYSSIKEVDFDNSLIEIIPLKSFFRCENLTKVNLSTNTKILESCAFYSCKNLNSIALNNIKKIGDFCFYRCSSLIKIDLSNVEDLNKAIGAFKGCTSLKEVILSSKVTFLPDEIFKGCINLEKINLENIEEIGKEAFKDCKNLKEIKLSKNCKIDSSSFDRTEFESKKSKEMHHYVDLGLIELSIDKKTIKKIPEFMYSRIYNLPEDIERIEADAAKCNKEIKELITPSTLRFIGEGAFQSSNLTKVDLDKSPLYFLNRKLFYNCSNLESITFNKEVKEIHDLAFSKCNKLKEIDLSNITKIGSGAFKDCSSLKLVKLSSLKGALGQEIFKNCSDLEEIILSNETTKIKKDAFKGCTSLRKINLKNVTKVEEGAFQDCINLEEIISSSSCLLEESSFINCPKIKSNLILKSKSINKEEKSNKDEFEIEGTRLIKVKKVNPDGSSIVPNIVTEISNKAFKNISDKLKKVILGSNVKELLDGTFSGFNSLEEVILNSKLSKIGMLCFYNTSITKIEIPESLNEIDYSAFQYCTKLKDIIVKSKHIKKIGQYSFYSCYALEKVELPDNIEVLEEGCFSNCGNLKTFIAKGVISIEKGAFKDTNNLVEVAFKDGCRYSKDNFKGNKTIKKFIKTHYKKV